MSMSGLKNYAGEIIIGAATLLSPAAKEESITRLPVDSIRMESGKKMEDTLALRRLDPIDTARSALQRESEELYKRATAMSQRRAPEAEWGKFCEDVERWNRRLERLEKTTKRDLGLEPIDPLVLRCASQAAQWVVDLMPRWMVIDAVSR